MQSLGAATLSQTTFNKMPHRMMTPNKILLTATLNMRTLSIRFYQVLHFLHFYAECYSNIDCFAAGP